MPYTIHKKNGKYCVIKKSTGEAIPGTSDSRDRALARIRAINIHEHESVHHEMGDDEDREFYESLDAEHRQMYDSLMEQAAAHRASKGTTPQRVQKIRERTNEIGQGIADREQTQVRHAQKHGYPLSWTPAKLAMKHHNDRKQSLINRTKPLVQKHLYESDESMDSVNDDNRESYESTGEQASEHRLNKGTRYQRIQNIRDRASEIGYKVAKRQMAAYPHANDPSKVMKHWQDRKQSIDQRVKPLIQNHL